MAPSPQCQEAQRGRQDQGEGRSGLGGGRLERVAAVIIKSTRRDPGSNPAARKKALRVVLRAASQSLAAPPVKWGSL